MTIGFKYERILYILMHSESTHMNIFDKIMLSKSMSLPKRKHELYTKYEKANEHLTSGFGFIPLTNCEEQ